MNYYEILKVNRNASDYDITHSYRRLAFQYHPDKNPERKEWAAEQFKILQNAYETLKDPDKRRQYDQELMRQEQSSFSTTTHLPPFPATPRQQSSATASASPPFTLEQKVVFYAKQQNWQQVFQLISEGVSPNELFEGYAALHYAVYHNNICCVNELLRFGANVDLPDISGNTPLHLSTIYRNYDICSLLISQNAQLSLQNHHGDTPLHIAIMLSQFNFIKLLFGKVNLPCVCNIQNHDGNTPLYIAMETLCYACKIQHSPPEQIKEWLDVVYLLIKYSANGLFIKNTAQNTPLSLLMLIKDDDVLTFENKQKLGQLRNLCEYIVTTMSSQPPTFPSSPSFWASSSTAPGQQFPTATSTSPSPAREQVAGINSPDTSGNTPLHIAMYELCKMCKITPKASPQQISNQLDIAIHLVNQGANCMLKNKQQMTPFDVLKLSNIGYCDVFTPENGHKIDKLAFMLNKKEEAVAAENRQQGSCSLQ